MPTDSPALRFALAPHPAAPCALALALEVECRVGATGMRLRYRLRGDVAGVRLPPAAARPGPADGLWRHTCFEAFLADAHGRGYREFNFSPSGDWAEYRFTAERQRAPDSASAVAPTMTLHVAADALVLTAELPRASLAEPSSEDPRTAASRALGLAAVIETRGGALSYWALAHPAGRPDFHQRAGWAARLPASTFFSIR